MMSCKLTDKVTVCILTDLTVKMEEKTEETDTFIKLSWKTTSEM